MRGIWRLPGKPWKLGRCSSGSLGHALTSAVRGGGGGKKERARAAAICNLQSTNSVTWRGSADAALLESKKAKKEGEYVVSIGAPPVGCRRPSSSSGMWKMEEGSSLHKMGCRCMAPPLFNKPRPGVQGRVRGSPQGSAGNQLAP